MTHPPYLQTQRTSELARLVRVQARLLRVQFVLLVLQAVVIGLMVADRI